MLENLMIYKKYVEFMYYVNTLLIKYPKSERFSLSSDIRTNLDRGLFFVIKYNKYSDLSFLEELDIILKMLLVFFRISYRSKYISRKNYESIMRKITELQKLRVGLINGKNNNKSI